MNVLGRLVRGARAGAVSPGVEQVTLTARFGCDPTDPRVRALSAIPQAVVVGLEHALRETSGDSLHARLALVEQEHRGFAYEGATMATTILDAMPRLRPGPGATHAVMSGAGTPHLLLNYIGIGFAMARLPRRLWSSVLPTHLSSRYHPTLAWLAVDGYGFDLAYFNPARYLRGQQRPKPYPWLSGQDWYFEKVVDQGFGRALWFAHAGQVTDVAREIGCFAPERRADLWSGIGLAATFAGQADDLAAMVPLAGQHAPDLGVGALLAAKARHEAGWVPLHSAEVVQATTGMTMATAVAAVDESEPRSSRDWPMPRYGVWRDQVRAVLQKVSG
ncbi:DUF1702 family protein [Aeromicrobium sp. CF3.5]|uniref:DUF1702 family protein n=1 Tax=Aeromicrobium sp. CF3.5 TaxID=3373078 RepID=UPI003EE5FAC0